MQRDPRRDPKRDADERLPRDQAARVLLDRRCDLYVKAAGAMLDVEDALDREDHERARYAFDELRRALRSSLAFLDEHVFRALERVEAVAPDSESAAAQEEELRDRLKLLHVKLARLLDLPGRDMADVIALPDRLRQRLEDDVKADEEREKRLEVEARQKQEELLARELIEKKQYKKAVKHLKKVVAAEPERAVLWNDLGVVYGLMGCHEQAVEHYKAAVELNEKFVDRRTDEWTTSYRNLGVALLRLAREEEHKDEVERALGHAREARAAVKSWLEVTPGGPRLAEARTLARRVDDEIGFLEERVREAAACGGRERGRTLPSSEAEPESAELE